MQLTKLMNVTIHEKFHNIAEAATVTAQIHSDAVLNAVVALLAALTRRDA